MAVVDFLNARLVTRIKAGDEACYQAAVEEYGERVAGAVRAYLGHTRDHPAPVQLVDDTCQEAWVRTWLAREKLDPTRPLVNFVIGIARNVLKEHGRLAEERHRGELAGMNPVEGDESVDELGRVVNPPADEEKLDPEERLLWSEEMEQLDRLTKELSPEQRRVLDLKYVERFSYAEIGQILGVDKKRAQTITENAIDKLLTVMRKAGIDWEAFAPFPRRQLPKPKIKGITKKEGPDGDGGPRASGPLREGSPQAPHPGGDGPEGEAPEGPDDEGDLG